MLSWPGFTYNLTGTISIPFIIPTGFIALSESECAGTELRVRHVWQATNYSLYLILNCLVRVWKLSKILIRTVNTQTVMFPSKALVMILRMACHLCVTNVTKFSKLWVGTGNICKLSIGFTCSEYETVSLHYIAAGHVFAQGGKKVHNVIVYTYYIHMYIYIYICIYRHI